METSIFSSKFIEQIIISWGPLVVIAFFMGKYILYKDKKFQDKETGFNECFKRQNETLIKVLQNNAEVITRNTDAINSIINKRR